jgi:hypothetical protein
MRKRRRFAISCTDTSSSKSGTKKCFPKNTSQQVGCLAHTIGNIRQQRIRLCSGHINETLPRILLHAIFDVPAVLDLITEYGWYANHEHVHLDFDNVYPVDIFIASFILHLHIQTTRWLARISIGDIRACCIALRMVYDTDTLERLLTDNWANPAAFDNQAFLIACRDGKLDSARVLMTQDEPVPSSTITTGFGLALHWRHIHITQWLYSLGSLKLSIGSFIDAITCGRLPEMIGWFRCVYLNLSVGALQRLMYRAVTLSQRHTIKLLLEDSRVDSIAVCNVLKRLLHKPHTDILIAAIDASRRSGKHYLKIAFEFQRCVVDNDLEALRDLLKSTIVDTDLVLHIHRFLSTEQKQLLGSYLADELEACQGAGTRLYY